MTVLTASIIASAGASAFGQEHNPHGQPSDFQVPFQVQQSPLYFFKAETFQPYVGGVFTARAGSHSIEMTLVKVRDCTPSAQSNKVAKKVRQSECFALIFSASGELTDLTTIYDVEHAALGKFALFMTRRDGPGDTHFYEAVFNRAL
jgi:hypothetical protein